MADLTASNFTVNDTWEEGDRSGKMKFLVKDVTIDSGTAGSTTNQIPASLFDMDEIVSIDHRGASNADPGKYLLMPDYAGDNIIAIDIEQATDANRGDTADIAFATFQQRLIIKGKPA
jgi:hypothetical protein